MKITPDEVQALDKNYIVSNIPGRRSEPYSWLDIVGVPGRPSGTDNKLFFATHSRGEGGWSYPFDRRPYAFKAARENNWVVAHDTSLPAEAGRPHLQVGDLADLSEAVYNLTREASSPYVVGVTGSVGKTTTVAMLEHMLAQSGLEVVRFYSKRLTPLSVMCHYINKVEQRTAVVVMEYSAYYRDHVAALAKLLPPNVAFLTNIYDTHINPNNPYMFENRGQIFDSKKEIKPVGASGFVNTRVLEELGVSTPAGWSTFNPELPYSVRNDRLPPTMRTAELFSVAQKLAEALGLTEEQLLRAYETFRPAEGRIITFKYNDRPVFFNGETSGGSRLNSWFETPNGVEPWLFVEKVDFAEENPEGFKRLTERVFSAEKTVVLDTPQNRERLEGVQNVRFLNEADFGNTFKKSGGYTIYHKAMAIREEGFDPEKWVNSRF